MELIVDDTGLFSISGNLFTNNINENAIIEIINKYLGSNEKW
jgi:hypothetical protein